MAQIQNVASEQFVANGGDGGPVVVAGVPAPDGHPPLAPGVHPPAPSVIEGLPELFVNPAGPKGLIWGPVPFIWNFVAAGAGWNIVNPGNDLVWTQIPGDVNVFLGPVGDPTTQWFIF
ncbi:hypothetical protein AX14_007918 [Amanita brunnescens Koide BX004]|nr:hypothetical protein AX14_007918 [Amanita brunnescens Koide BX004]